MKPNCTCFLNQKVLYFDRFQSHVIAKLTHGKYLVILLIEVLLDPLMQVSGIALTFAGDQHNVFGINNEALNFHFNTLYMLNLYSKPG